MSQKQSKGRNHEINKNENTTYNKLWDAAKAGLKGKFRMINAHIKKGKISNKQSNFTPQGTRKSIN